MYISCRGQVSFRKHYPAVIVGGGPVGIFVAALLEEYGVPHCLVERRVQPTAHPQAHFMHARTSEILRAHLPNAYKQILQEKPDSKDWRDFVYCYSLLGREYARLDHFSTLYDNSSSYGGKGEETHWNHTPANVIHLPQNKLERILREELAKAYAKGGGNVGRASFGSSVSSIETVDGKHTVTLDDGNAFTCDYLVGADGARSRVRQYAGVDMQGPESMQTLINVHFTCKGLSAALGGTSAEVVENRNPENLAAEVGCGAPSRLEHALYEQAEGAALKAKEKVEDGRVSASVASRPGMLYFVFNERTVCVFVHHDPSQDEWVCQIPVFPPFQSLDDYSAGDLVKIVQQGLGLGASSQGRRQYTVQEADIRVLSFNTWTMHAQVASSFRAFPPDKTANSGGTQKKGKGIFLVGDAAHRFPPSGGFGMNSGLQDAHNLAWKLARDYHDDKDNVSYSNSTSKGDILATYDSERRPVASALTSLSLQNYEKSEKVARSLGVDPKLAHLGLSAAQAASIVPFSLRKKVVQQALATGLASLAFLSEARRGHPLGQFRVDAVARMVDEGESLPLLFPEQDLFTPYASPPEDLDHLGSTARGSTGTSLHVPSRVDLGVLGTVVPYGRFPHLWLQVHTSVHNNRLRVVSSTELPAMLSADSTGRPANMLLLLGEWAKSDLEVLAVANQASHPSPRVPVVLISSIDERFEQRTAQLQRKFQRPHYSRSRKDLVDVPVESSGLDMERRVRREGGATGGEEEPVGTLELLEVSEMSGALRIALGSGRNKKKVAAVLRPDGHVAHGGIAALPADSLLESGEAGFWRDFLSL